MKVIGSDVGSNTLEVERQHTGQITLRIKNGATWLGDIVISASSAKRLAAMVVPKPAKKRGGK